MKGDQSYSLVITPSTPNRDSRLVLTSKGFSLADSKITWMINGAIDDAATGSGYSPSQAQRGSSIQAMALYRGNEIPSNTVTIGNAPPAIGKVKFVPDVFNPGDKLGVEVIGTDSDGDDVALLYEWTVNGRPAGNQKALNQDLKRGDIVIVKITPFDGQEYGTPAVARREIMNIPPIISEHKEFSFDGSLYTYQVKASDPDGDTLEYSLQSPAEGMTIDPATGLMKWNVPPDFKGKKNVSFIVRDGHGGTATYSYEITIQ